MASAAPMENSKLYVGNIPFATTAQDLEALLSQAGTVSVVEIIFDKFTGRSRGFAFVTMASPAEAQKAAEEAGAETISVATAAGSATRSKPPP
jgi:cold-inducible RNA-binding protein